MRRMGILMLSLVVLFGCADIQSRLRSSPQDETVEEARRAARNALQEARTWEAPKYRPDEFDAARSKFDVTRQRSSEFTTEELVNRYRRAETMANRATIDSLLDQMDEKDEEVSQLKQRIGTLEQELKQLNQNLAEVREQNQILQQDLERVREQKNPLTQRVQRLESENRNLEDKLEEVKQERMRLQRRLQQHERQLEQRERALEKREQQIESLESDLAARTRELQDLRQENQSIAREFREKLEEASVREEQGGVVVNIQEKVLFDLGKAVLKSGAKQTLRKVVSVLRKYPEREIRVEGHTDTLPIHTERFPSNWELSSQRALNVLKYMTGELGIQKRRIAAVAYGEYQPLLPNTSPENRARNRRVEIVLLPKKRPRTTREASESGTG